MNPEDIMRIALEEAEIAVKEGNAPFACIVTNEMGEIVLREHDRVRELMDPTAHGEINAVRKLCSQLHTLKLENYTFYTTSEPCPTCLSSMIKAKVPTAFYGAKTETTASLPIPAEELAARATKYQIKITGGILVDEALEQRNRLS